MAITLEANYSRKIGLPGYSSHQYSITVRKEVADVARIQAESEQLYAILRSSVDNEFRENGWLPCNSNANQSHAELNPPTKGPPPEAHLTQPFPQIVGSVHGYPTANDNLSEVIPPKILRIQFGQNYQLKSTRNTRA